jgi:hypothetical protein
MTKETKIIDAMRSTEGFLPDLSAKPIPHHKNTLSDLEYRTFPVLEIQYLADASDGRW